MKKLKKNELVQVSLITFVLTSICMMIIYALNKTYPFGSKTILAYDMSGQYVNYLAYFRNIFTDNANIFYNFSMNLGSNCYGLFAYYISNPLNIILLFFNVEHITEGILILNIIKIALASVAMTILLKKTTKLNKTYTIILSIMYALMSYNIVYSQNIMWLDGTIYLPLIVLGIDKIIKKQSSLLYISSLLLCIISNFYIGYMVGIFSVIYTIFRFILLSDNIKSFWKENKSILWEYIKATIITLLLSMVLLLPVLINLLNSKAEISLGNFRLSTYYSPIDVLSKMLIGAFDSTQLPFGPPNIYCGCLCIIMVILFFANRKISKKERILTLSLITLISLCFIIEPLNIALHMLQSPVWFPFRYSFIFSFILILISAKNLENTESIDFNCMLKTQAIIILVLLILGKLNYSYITNMNIILTSLFIIINGLLLVYNLKRKKGQVLLIILIMLEMITNGYQIIKRMGYVERNDFLDVFNTKEIVEKYKSEENEFYRIDNHKRRSLNDDMLFNCNGIYHYSSTSGKNNKNFLTNFGLRNCLISENGTDITLPMLSILGIKYSILNGNDVDRANNNIPRFNMDYFNKVDEIVLENKYNLNLGYVVNNKSKEIELKENEPLENQNELLSKIANIDEKIFEKVDIENKEKIVKEKNEEMYLVVKLGNISAEAIQVYFDNKLAKNVFEANEKSNNIVYIPKNVEVIDIKVEEDCKDKYTIDLYRFLNENFEKVYNKISKNQLNIVLNKNNYIKATINSDIDGTLLTSIIYDNGWNIKIDGKKVEKQAIAKDLLAVDISKGNHTVEFTFIPSGFNAGLILTFLGLAWFIIDKIKNKKKKIEHNK